MNSKILLSITAGVLGTVLMMVVMLIAPLLGLPQMNQPEMISRALGGTEILGWGLYFFMGAGFGVIYHYIFAVRVPIESNIIKGLLFGTIVFAFAQISLRLLPAAGGNMPEQQGSMITVLLGSFAGHLVYGLVVALIEKDDRYEEDDEYGDVSDGASN